MAENSSPTLTEGSVARAIARVSAPMSLGILAVISVGLADAYFLGLIGQEELAAVGFIFPVTTAVTSLSIGLSAGANAVLSQAIGADESDGAVKRAALHSVGIASVLSVLAAVGLWVISPWLFGVMGATGAVAENIDAYIPIWCASFPLLVTMMVTNAAFRAHGDGARAATMMVIAAVVNIGLNPLLIFGWAILPELGMAGAAWATFVARAVAMVLSLAWAWKLGLIGQCGALFSDFVRSARNLAHVGGPAAFSNAVNPAGLAMVTAAVATLGDAAVAGFGAATRVQSIALVPLLALSSGIGPVVGQNWGAGKEDRARKAVLQTFGFCLAYGVLLGIVLFFAADVIATVIASDEDAARYTAQYLAVVGWSMAGYGILVTANAAMNARSKPLWSMGLSLARTFALYLPLAWIGVSLFDYAGIIGAAVLANGLIVVGVLIAARSTGLLGGEVKALRPATWGAEARS